MFTLFVGDQVVDFFVKPVRIPRWKRRLPSSPTGGKANDKEDSKDGEAASIYFRLGNTYLGEVGKSPPS
jgi:hypothetical protein